MEEAVLVNFDPNVNGVVMISPQQCQTWEVVCTELPIQLSNSTQVVEVEEKVEQNKLTDVGRRRSSRKKTSKVSREEKKLGPDCDCPLKCFQKLGEEAIQTIFKDFWALADHNSQNAYLFGLINLVGVKRRYTKNQTSRRNFTIVYHVKDKGRNVAVCKKAFLNIHGLQRNRGRINNLANKMKEGKSAPPPDKRGRHNNRPNAYSEEAIEHVRKHLLRCPKLDRRKNYSKIMAFSTKRCYALYVDEYCKDNEVVPVSLDKFRRVFAMEGYKNLRRTAAEVNLTAS